MYRVELYAQVRRSVYVEGISEREAVRRFGIARETVRKMLRYATLPGYQRRKPVRRPKLGAFTGIIDHILVDDREEPRKQRHTAKRIHERLRDEYGFDGCYSSVKEYVREKKLVGQEMFVPLSHPPGDAQGDYGEAIVVVAGVRRKARFLVVDLPHSDEAFVKAFPAETTEAFCEGHNAAFRYFGGVLRTIVYDNTKLAVARILGDGTRKLTRSSPVSGPAEVGFRSLALRAICPTFPWRASAFRKRPGPTSEQASFSRPCLKTICW